MASVRVVVDRGDGLRVEFERDDHIVDQGGDRTLELLARLYEDARRTLTAIAAREAR